MIGISYQLRKHYFTVFIILTCCPGVRYAMPPCPYQPPFDPNPAHTRHALHATITAFLITSFWLRQFDCVDLIATILIIDLIALYQFEYTHPFRLCLTSWFDYRIIITRHKNASPRENNSGIRSAVYFDYFDYNNQGGIATPLPQSRCQIDLGSVSGAHYIGCHNMRHPPKLTAKTAKSANKCRVSQSFF